MTYLGPHTPAGVFPWGRPRPPQYLPVLPCLPCAEIWGSCIFYSLIFKTTREGVDEEAEARGESFCHKLLNEECIKPKLVWLQVHIRFTSLRFLSYWKTHDFTSSRILVSTCYGLHCGRCCGKLLIWLDGGSPHKFHQHPSINNMQPK